MNFAVVVSIFSASTALVFALLAQAISRAPGWRRMRSVAGISTTAAIFIVMDVPLTLRVSPEVTAWASRLSLVAAALHFWAWTSYLVALDDRAPARWERVLRVVMLALGCSAALGNLAITDTVVLHEVRWLGVTYADAVPSAWGNVLFVVSISGLLLPLVRFARRWLKRTARVGAQTLGLLILTLAGVNDALVAGRAYDGPYLLDVGFLAVAVAVGLTLGRDFSASADRLQVLTLDLERAVASRSQALAVTTEALGRSEKLAAIGQLAAGVAHEINNPTAVLKANLTYLKADLDAGLLLPADARDSLGDSLLAVERITRIVRQLLDAGRSAGPQHGTARAFRLGSSCRAAVDQVRLKLGEAVSIELQVPDELCAWGHASLLEQVLANLVLNASHAIGDAGRSGRVRVTARREGPSAVVSVVDDGPGLSSEAQKHLFEAFFTTKAVGRGTGLGLAVSLGLMRAQGGDLRLVSTSERGCEFSLTLRSANADDLLPTAPEAPRAQATGLKVLLVDDEHAVAEALARTLKGSLQVETCHGVEAALARLRRGPKDFDAIICDVLMPEGGGERFTYEVLAVAPAMGPRIVYITGGAVGEAATRFVAAQAGRVLAKPVDTAELVALVQRLTLS